MHSTKLYSIRAYACVTCLNDHVKNALIHSQFAHVASLLAQSKMFEKCKNSHFLSHNLNLIIPLKKAQFMSILHRYKKFKKLTFKTTIFSKKLRAQAHLNPPSVSGVSVKTGRARIGQVEAAEQLKNTLSLVSKPTSKTHKNPQSFILRVFSFEKLCTIKNYLRH